MPSLDSEIGVRCPGCGAESAAPRVLLRGHDRLTGAPGEFEVIACAHCQLAFTTPRLGAEDFETYYPRSYSAYAPGAGSRGRRRSLGERIESLWLEGIARLGPYRPIWRRGPGRLLDVGCGTGDLASVFARHGWDVAGLEPSAVAATHARAAGIDVTTGTLADAPWPAGSFDAIIFNHSLEHIDAPAQALRDAARLLRPGGLVAIAVPNYGSWQRRAFGAAWFQLDLPRHLQHFDRPSLSRLVSDAGLRPTAVSAASMRPSPIASLQYVAFGRMRFEGRGFRALAWIVAPFLALVDRIAEGDCLHLIAER